MMRGTCSTNGENDKWIQNFCRKTSRDETTWEYRPRREDNIKIILRETDVRAFTRFSWISVRLKGGLLLIL